MRRVLWHLQILTNSLFASSDVHFLRGGIHGDSMFIVGAPFCLSDMFQVSGESMRQDKFLATPGCREALTDRTYLNTIVNDVMAQCRLSG